MDYIRPAIERGITDFGWLQSRHSFSFGSYLDPKHMGFSVLRVINEDQVVAGEGFGRHGHRDMEIITYVLSGVLEHKDSLGNKYRVRAGEVQRMSAGTGVVHSEYNASDSEPVHFLQVWIMPSQIGIAPGYQQREFLQSAPLTLLVTPDGRDGTLSLHQDANLYRLKLNGGEAQRLVSGERLGYLHVIKGEAQVRQRLLSAGDGLGVTSHQEFSVEAAEQGLEALWFDLPGLVAS